MAGCEEAAEQQRNSWFIWLTTRRHAAPAAAAAAAAGNAPMMYEGGPRSNLPPARATAQRAMPGPVWWTNWQIAFVVAYVRPTWRGRVRWAFYTQSVRNCHWRRHHHHDPPGSCINLRQPALVYLIAGDFRLVDDCLTAVGLASLLNCDDLAMLYQLGDDGGITTCFLAILIPFFNRAYRRSTDSLVKESK